MEKNKDKNIIERWVELLKSIHELHSDTFHAMAPSCDRRAPLMTRHHSDMQECAYAGLRNLSPCSSDICPLLSKD